MGYSIRSDLRAEGPEVRRPRTDCGPGRPGRRVDHPDLSPAASFLHPELREAIAPDLMVWLDGVLYRVKPLIDVPGPHEGRAWRLDRLDPAPRAPELVIVFELEDADQGCPHPTALGLHCTCDDYLSRPKEPCLHLDGLVRLGLLRPATPWSEWLDPDAPLALTSDD